jgi:hypothetical protein
MSASVVNETIAETSMTITPATNLCVVFDNDTPVDKLQAESLATINSTSEQDQKSHYGPSVRVAS